MVFKKPLTGEQRAFALFLYQEKKYSLAQIAVRAKMSKTSVWRLIRGNLLKTSCTENNKKRGRCELLSLRDKGKLNRSLNFASPGESKLYSY